MIIFYIKKSPNSLILKGIWGIVGDWSLSYAVKLTSGIIIRPGWVFQKHASSSFQMVIWMPILANLVFKARQMFAGRGAQFL